MNRIKFCALGVICGIALSLLIVHVSAQPEEKSKEQVHGSKEAGTLTISAEMLRGHALDYKSAEEFGHAVARNAMSCTADAIESGKTKDPSCDCRMWTEVLTYDRDRFTINACYRVCSRCPGAPTPTCFDYCVGPRYAM